MSLDDRPDILREGENTQENQEQIELQQLEEFSNIKLENVNNVEKYIQKYNSLVGNTQKNESGKTLSDIFTGKIYSFFYDHKDSLTENEVQLLSKKIQENNELKSNKEINAIINKTNYEVQKLKEKVDTTIDFNLEGNPYELGFEENIKNANIQYATYNVENYGTFYDMPNIGINFFISKKHKISLSDNFNYEDFKKEEGKDMEFRDDLSSPYIQSKKNGKNFIIYNYNDKGLHIVKIDKKGNIDYTNLDNNEIDSNYKNILDQEYGLKEYVEKINEKKLIFFSKLKDGIEPFDVNGEKISLSKEVETQIKDFIVEKKDGKEGLFVKTNETVFTMAIFQYLKNPNNNSKKIAGNKTIDEQMITKIPDKDLDMIFENYETFYNFKEDFIKTYEGNEDYSKNDEIIKNSLLRSFFVRKIKDGDSLSNYGLEVENIDYSNIDGVSKYFANINNSELIGDVEVVYTEHELRSIFRDSLNTYGKNVDGEMVIQNEQEFTNKLISLINKASYDYIPLGTSLNSVIKDYAFSKDYLNIAINGVNIEQESFDLKEYLKKGSEIDLPDFNITSNTYETIMALSSGTKHKTSHSTVGNMKYSTSKSYERKYKQDENGENVKDMNIDDVNTLSYKKESSEEVKKGNLEKINHNGVSKEYIYTKDGKIIINLETAKKISENNEYIQIEIGDYQGLQVKQVGNTIEIGGPIKQFGFGAVKSITPTTSVSRICMGNLEDKIKENRKIIIKNGEVILPEDLDNIYGENEVQPFNEEAIINIENIKNNKYEELSDNIEKDNSNVVDIFQEIDKNRESLRTARKKMGSAYGELITAKNEGDYDKALDLIKNNILKKGSDYSWYVYHLLGDDQSKLDNIRDFINLKGVNFDKKDAIAKETAKAKVVDLFFEHCFGDANLRGKTDGQKSEEFKSQLAKEKEQNDEEIKRLNTKIEELNIEYEKLEAAEIKKLDEKIKTNKENIEDIYKEIEKIKIKLKNIQSKKYPKLDYDNWTSWSKKPNKIKEMDKYYNPDYNNPNYNNPKKKGFFEAYISNAIKIFSDAPTIRFKLRSKSAKLFEVTSTKSLRELEDDNKAVTELNKNFRELINQLKKEKSLLETNEQARDNLETQKMVNIKNERLKSENLRDKLITRNEQIGTPEWAKNMTLLQYIETRGNFDLNSTINLIYGEDKQTANKLLEISKNNSLKEIHEKKLISSEKYPELHSAIKAMYNYFYGDLSNKGVLNNKTSKGVEGVSTEKWKLSTASYYENNKGEHITSFVNMDEIEIVDLDGSGEVSDNDFSKIEGLDSDSKILEQLANALVSDPVWLNKINTEIKNTTGTELTKEEVKELILNKEVSSGSTTVKADYDVAFTLWNRCLNGTYSIGNLKLTTKSNSLEGAIIYDEVIEHKKREIDKTAMNSIEVTNKATKIERSKTKPKDPEGEDDDDKEDEGTTTGGRGKSDEGEKVEISTPTY